MKKHIIITILLLASLYQFIIIGCGAGGLYKAIREKDYAHIESYASNLDKDDPGMAKYTVTFHLDGCSDSKVIEAFISGGYPIHLTDLNRNTLLMIACNSGCFESAKLLIENGAYIGATQIDGWTPLLLATKSKPVPLRYEWYYSMGINPTGVWQAAEWIDTSQKPQIAMLLIERMRSSIDQRGKKGETPLMFAGGSGYQEVVLLLIDKGADVNATDFTVGWTPLHWASFNNHIDVVRILIEKGANINAKNNEGFTALSITANADHNELFDVLIEHGAEIVPIDDKPYTNGKLYFYAAQSKNQLFHESSKQHYQIAADYFSRAYDKLKNIYDGLHQARSDKIKEESWNRATKLMGDLLTNVIIGSVLDAKATYVSVPPQKMDLSAIDKALEQSSMKMAECQKYRQQCIKLSSE